MSRSARLPALLVWLTALWVALWGDLTIGNVVGGFVVAVGVLVVARATGVGGLRRSYFRPLAALRYFVYFLGQLVTSNLVVAWEIVTPKSHLQRGIIRVPMHSGSAGVVTLVANSITLTPGTVTVDVHEAPQEDGTIRRDLFIHVLKLGDVSAASRGILQLERLAIRAFGSSDELVAVDRALADLDGEGRQT